MKIAIDPGHGGYELGASYNGIHEKNLNLSISNHVIKELASKLGLKIISTRTSDVYVSLEHRVYYVNKLQADLFVSIHCNAFTNNSAHGFEVYHYGSEKGKKLARDVYTSVVDNIILYPRGIKEANFYVLKYTQMPAILIECGFMSNAKDLTLLVNHNFQIKLASLIVKGILGYLSDLVVVS